ncbi:Phosphoserine phosphatase [uncultured archaeon]|nr:Phosphoserine phosphatase [uncultured archaeon]
MKVSVIIPVLNEEKTIASVVSLAKKNPAVKEVIVVDDRSTDDTVANAKQAGATVIVSTKRGKGISMLEGLMVSKGDFLVFLDGDIANYEPDVVERLIRPLLDDEADFIKSTFERQAGRVTELMAKPLLNLLLPEASLFAQPLSGIIAGKRSFFEKVEFENDYGVDIGLLIDMIQLGARVKEVSIGRIDNKMKDWQHLSPMSADVARAILKRTKIRPSYLFETFEYSQVALDPLEHAVKENLRGRTKMVIFDLDNTLLMGRFIEKAAIEYNFSKELRGIRSQTNEPFLTTKLVARLLKGLNVSQLLAVVEKISVIPGTGDVIKELKGRGYVVGIVTDSYEFVANQVAHKIGADFVIANELEFSKGVATGEVKIPSYYTKNSKSVCRHNLCKSNVLVHLSNQYSIPLKSVMAVGDGENDVCMVEHAGLGVAFCSNNNKLNSVADVIIRKKSFKPLLEYAR